MLDDTLLDILRQVGFLVTLDGILLSRGVKLLESY